MKRSVNRRTAITAAAASTGMLMSGGGKSAKAGELKDVWGEDFMLQWSPPSDLKRDLRPGKTPIRLSCEKFRLRNDDKVSFEDQAKAIRAAGYTACEAGSWGWNDLTDSKIKELKAVLKEHDVQFYTLHTWVNIIHPDATERRNFQKHVAHAVEQADALGLGFVLTHTGGNYPDRNKDIPHPENWTKETWMRSVEATKQILKDTAGSKVNLAFEAVNSCNNNTPQSHVRLKEDVGDSRVRVCLDPVNMLHPGVIFRTTELINTCFDLIGEDIEYAHAKDLSWPEMIPRFKDVTLGEGLMDYETYLVRLSHMKKPRVLLIEHLPDEQYPPSKRFLEDTAKRLGVTIHS